MGNMKMSKPNAESVHSGPLSGVRVLDLSRAMAGPFCTQLLGDMGADVIKVEAPDKPDETRQWGPFWNGVSCYYMSANRNKRAIAIDLKKSEGRAIILKLAAHSDVFIENFRPGVIGRLGLDYETLVALNPRLVYCSISGFGQSGPRAGEPAYDLKMQGFTGLMSLTGFPDAEPVRVGLPVTDLAAGLYAAFAIAAALSCRERTGQGQKIETSLMEGQVAWLSFYLIGYFANGILPKPMGSAHQSLAPYRVYRAQDDYFILAVGSDEQWQRFCAAVEQPGLGDDPRFRTNQDRLLNRQAMDRDLEQVFQRYRADELIQRLNHAGVPCGPFHTLDQIAADPQVLQTGMVVEVPHSKVAGLKMPGIPIKFSRTPGKIRRPPPGLGEHTEQILSELGYQGDQISALRKDGTIG